MKQLDMFGAAPTAAPLPVTRSRTWIKDGIVHIHLVDGQVHSEALTRGPLTRGECAQWVVPCRLMACRHRLEDDVVSRTRRLEPEEPEDDLFAIEDYEGPRDARGAYYSDTPLDSGTWCALSVAERGERDDIRAIDENVSLQKIGDMYGCTREAARVMVEEAAADLNIEDICNDRELRSYYGDRGSVKKRPKHDDKLDHITDSQMRLIKVPGPVLERGMRVASRRPRRPRKDPWIGARRVVPEAFEHMVDPRLMNRLVANDRIPEKLMKPLKPPPRRAQ